MRRRASSKLSREATFRLKPLLRRERSQHGAVILLRVRDLFLIRLRRKGLVQRVLLRGGRRSSSPIASSFPTTRRPP
uniref:Uncharacterized protein n=1 Tax=Brassica oleracea var. oleracea TaxID=109376 RepID=A0A0D2ZW66_BRAOL